MHVLFAFSFHYITLMCLPVFPFKRTEIARYEDNERRCVRFHVIAKKIELLFRVICIFHTIYRTIYIVYGESLFLNTCVAIYLPSSQFYFTFRCHVLSSNNNKHLN